MFFPVAKTWVLPEIMGPWLEWSQHTGPTTSTFHGVRVHQFDKKIINIPEDRMIEKTGCSVCGLYSIKCLVYCVNIYIYVLYRSSNHMLLFMQLMHHNKHTFVLYASLLLRRIILCCYNLYVVS